MITGDSNFYPGAVWAVASDLMDTLIDPEPTDKTLTLWAGRLGLAANDVIEAAHRHEIASGAGEISREEFVIPVLADCEVEVSLGEARLLADELTRLRRLDMKPFPEAFWLIARIRRSRRSDGGLRRFGTISILSHISLDAVKLLGFEAPNLDATVYSAETGLLKTEPAAFIAICERLGVELQHCLFVDDRLDYVQTAKGMGMMAVVVMHPTGHAFKSVDDMRQFRLDQTASGVIVIDRIGELADLLELP